LKVERGKLVGEREVLLDAIDISLVGYDSATEAATALGALGLQQMALAGAGAQDFAGASDLEPFGDGFSCFDSLRATHKYSAFSQKERAL
jgi:hypothetical protein